MVLAHLLQNLDEKSNLNLCGLLEKGIQSSRSLGFAQHLEPLFDGAEFIFEVLIEGCSSHLFQCCLILIDIGNPLLCKFIGSCGFWIVLFLHLMRLAIEV